MPSQYPVLFGRPNWVLPTATVDLDFANGRYWTLGATGPLSFSRASVGTNLLPTSPSEASYQTFQSGVARITPGLGLLIEEVRTNFLLNSATPATQTTASLATGTYTLWVNGSGSATMTLGTGVGCGTSSATQGNPISFTLTVAGTCIVTVAGSLNAFQLEPNPGSVSFGTSFIPTGASPVTRAADVASIPVSVGLSYSTYGIGTPFAPSTYGNENLLILAATASDSNRFITRRDASGFPHILQVSGGTVNINTAVGGAASWVAGVSGKLAFFNSGSTQRAAYNGTLDFNTYTQTPAVSPNTLYIGVDPLSNTQWNGYISMAAFSPKSLLAY